MLNKIPWYVAAFQSFPESLLLLSLGLLLLRIKLNPKAGLIISGITAVSGYLMRYYFSTFGLHTIITMVLLILLTRLIGKIKLIHSVIGVILGVLIVGVLQMLTVPGLLNMMGLNMTDLAVYSYLNIVLFIPCALIMGIAYMTIAKKGFYLIDFNAYYTD